VDLAEEVAALSATTHQLPAPAAGRLRRPSWRDPRLLVGVVIVLVSVALGAQVIATADDTVPVWASRTTLAPGAVLSVDELTVARVRLEGDAATRYLSAASPPATGQVLLRTVGPGELVPSSAVGAASALDLRPVVIPATPPLPVALAAGAVVDLWVSRKAATTGGAGNAFEHPERLVQGAVVRAISKPSGTLGSGSGSVGVEVMLDAQQLPAVLDALANQAVISLEPVPGSGPSGSSRSSGNGGTTGGQG